MKQRLSSFKNLKQVTGTMRSTVGDGFSIRRALPHPNLDHLDPFLLLDHAGPTQVTPSNTPKGVDEHPHRGFETVTIVYHGALTHRDSAGNRGNLYAGDVQWMTAASGIVHEEKNEIEFTKKGGTLELIQLWVNLPAKYKMTAPSYQDISASSIPLVNIDENGQSMRIIAGEYEKHKGPASTFTSLNVWDMMFVQHEAPFLISVPETHQAGIYVLSGTVKLQNERLVEEGKMAFFEKYGYQIEILAQSNARALLLSGEPIEEPVASYGPFVMNTQEELQQAFKDYQNGKMGFLS